MKNIVDSIKTNLQPQGRAIATSGSFELFFKNAPSLNEGSLDKALRVLATAKSEGEAGNVAGRRATCAEVANLTDGRGGSIETAVKAWGEWVAYLSLQIATVPDDQKGRFSAMLATAERELAELKA
jgi:hypothetical protein